MARFELTRNNILRYQQKLEKRCNHVKNYVAYSTYEFLHFFGYHAKWSPGPWRMNGPGWTYYYALNWNIGRNAVDTSTYSPERDHKNEKTAKFAGPLFAKDGRLHDPFERILVGDKVYVTNSLYYGPWLNYGGYLEDTYCEFSHPNLFLEKAWSRRKEWIELGIKEAKDKIRKI